MTFNCCCERLLVCFVILSILQSSLPYRSLYADDVGLPKELVTREHGEPELLSIAQYRALMERDLHREVATQSMKIKAWAKMRDACLAALQLEKQVYGEEFKGDKWTVGALTIAYLQNHELNAVIDLLPDEEASNKKLLRVLIDGDRPRDETIEFFNLIVNMANGSVESTQSDTELLARLERLNSLASELDVLDRIPEISWSLANHYANRNERDKALLHAKRAYRHSRDERNLNADTATIITRYGNFYFTLLRQAADELANRNQWNDSIPLRQELWELAKELGENVGSAELALKTSQRVLKMSPLDRERLASADAGMQMVWVKVGKQDVKGALEGTYLARQTFEEVLGKDSDGYAYCTRVAGFLNWRLGNYDIAFKHLSLASELLLNTRGPNDKMTRESISDACVNAIATATSSAASMEVAKSLRNLEALINDKYDRNSHTLALVVASRMHVERLSVLTDVQHSQLLKLNTQRSNRNMLYSQGHYADAAVVAENIVSRTEVLLGMDNRLWIEDLFSLANCQNQAMQLDTAENNYQRLIDATARAPFNNLAERVEHMRWYADMLQRAGRIDDSLAMLTKTKLVTEEIMGKRSAAIAHVLRVQSRIYTDKLFQPGLALPLLVEATEILRVSSGTENYEYVQALMDLGNCERMLLLYRDAEQHLSESLTIRHRLPQSDKAQMALNINCLGMVFAETDREDQAIRLFQQAILLKEQINPEAGDLSDVYANLISALIRRGDREQADSWLKKLQSVRQNSWAKNDPRFAEDLIKIASAIMAGKGYFFQGFHEVTKETAEFIEPLIRTAAQIRADAFGETSLQYVEAQHRLGCLFMCSGRVQAAIPILVAARVNAIESGKPGLKLNALISSDLSIAFSKSGDYVRALPIRLETTKELRASSGDYSPYVANSLLSTAQIYSMIGDVDRAEASAREAAEIFRMIGHKRQNDCYMRLALIYLNSGELDLAEQYLHFVRQISRSDIGHTPELESASQLALVRLYFAQGEYDRVIELAGNLKTTDENAKLDESLTINLQEMSAMAMVRKGEFDKAHEIIDIVLSTRAQIPSSDPLANLRAYEALSELQFRKGDLGGALKWARQSLALAEEYLYSVSAVLSERQQLLIRKTIRNCADHYISLALQSESETPDLYKFVLRWKGGVFLKQRSIKNTLHDTDSDTKLLIEELATINRQLSSAAFNTFGISSAEWTGIMQRFSDRKELLESQLAQHAVSIQSAEKADQISALDFVNGLPNDVVLIDFLNFRFHPRLSSISIPETLGSGPRESEEHLLMFVVSNGKPIIVKDIGSTDTIENDIQQWRQTVLKGRASEMQVVGRRLRKTLLDQAEPLLTPDKTVLISPDGALSQLPFNALPGTKEGTFLLEEHRLATIAVPQILIEKDSHVDASYVSKNDKILLVGNIDFTGTSGVGSGSVTSIAAPNRSADGTRLTWQPLPGTKSEIDSIRITVDQNEGHSHVVTLSGSDATESALRSRVPDARWVHFATHGFFADSGPVSKRNTQSLSRSLESTVMGRESIPGFHPGLLSGLVFSGANRIPEPNQEDGILTAVEIVEMDLRHVEMTVMSACETGLGESSGGEGVLGIQRALQLSGCRSVVASLWKVDDRATEKLMEQFYENIWDEKLGKLDALRQAQIAMLRNYDWQAGTLRGDSRIKSNFNHDHFTFTPPMYWAAFVLSGDWR